MEAFTINLCACHGFVADVFDLKLLYRMIHLVPVYSRLCISGGLRSGKFGLEMTTTKKSRKLGIANSGHFVCLILWKSSTAQVEGQETAILILLQQQSWYLNLQQIPERLYLSIHLCNLKCRAELPMAQPGTSTAVHDQSRRAGWLQWALQGENNIPLHPFYTSPSSLLRYLFSYCSIKNELVCII